MLLALTGSVAALPLYWMVASSLKATDELGRLPPIWWSANPSLHAFEQVFSVIPYAQAFLNSFVIAAGDTIAIVLTSVMAGYVFAKYRFRGRDALFLAVLATMFIPTVVTLVPLYHVIRAAGLVDSYAGVMLPQLANAFGIFLMRQFIAGIPDELIDAARIDGASEWTVLWRVIVPLLWPAIATLVLFAFVFHVEQLPVALDGPAGQNEKSRSSSAMSQLLGYYLGIQNSRTGDGRARHQRHSEPDPVRLPAALLRWRRRPHRYPGMSRNVLAVDVGGTKVAIAVIGADGDVVEELRFATPRGAAEAAVDEVLGRRLSSPSGTRL